MTRHDTRTAHAHTRRYLEGAALDHALGEQVGEGLGEVEVALGVEELGDEARVEQVQDGVLYPADVDVDRHPLVRHRLVERSAHKSYELQRARARAVVWGVGCGVCVCVCVYV
jgi:hypothetical protein